MSTVVVQYEVKPERAEENQVLIERVFAELSERPQEGLHYATFRFADGVTFVHIASSDPGASTSTALVQVAAFTDFQAGIADRCAVAPVVHDAHLVGSFRFLDA
jgi:hypothetical protein